MAAMPDALRWRVLLIGGGAGVGKTTAARHLAHQLGVPCVLVDDIRMALQRVTTPAQVPALHYFLQDTSGTSKPPVAVFARPPEALCQALVDIGRIVTDALIPMILHHLHVEAAGPLVLEGCDIIPDLVAGTTLGGFATRGLLRAVFVVESDAPVIGANMQRQARGLEHCSETARVTAAAMNWRYGQLVRAEAERCGLPVVEARPWTNLVDRLLKAAS